MNPYYAKMIIALLEELPLDLELSQIEDEGLKDFMKRHEILETLYEQNMIEWKGDVLVPKKKKKGEKTNVTTHWDEVKKLININGEALEQWNKRTRQRWVAQACNINEIERLRLKGYSYKDIAETLNYIAQEKGQYTPKLSSVLEPIAFKQYFDMKTDNSADRFTKTL